MFKSCQYCRHRKKKCVWETAAHTGSCVACYHLGVVCEVEARQPSLKRRSTSQRVASRIKAGDRRVSQHSLPDRVAYSLRGDCQIPGGKAAKELFLEDRSSKFIGLDPVEIYKQILQHEVPFIPDEHLIGDSSLLFKICVELAANISINNGPGALGEDEVQKLTILAHEQLWTEQEAAGLLLLLPRLCLESAIVEKVFNLLGRSADTQGSTTPITAGIATSHAWLTLCRRPCGLINIPPTVLLDYGATLDPKAFATHFLKLTHLAARFVRLSQSSTGDLTSETIRSWARLEYSSLLSVVEMDTQFLDLRDDMPASVAAVVTHMLQNLIYLRLYSFLLCDMPHIGEAISLRPVPGVLYFICAVARSTFVCQSQVIKFWPLIVEIQSEAARVMMKLWRRTNFENCKALLDLWQPTSAHEDLAEEARQCLGTGPWNIEHIDGFSVFWTFRDVRSLSLEVFTRS